MDVRKKPQKGQKANPFDLLIEVHVKSDCYNLEAKKKIFEFQTISRKYLPPSLEQNSSLKPHAGVSGGAYAWPTRPPGQRGGRILFLNSCIKAVFNNVVIILKIFNSCNSLMQAFKKEKEPGRFIQYRLRPVAIYI